MDTREQPVVGADIFASVETTGRLQYDRTITGKTDAKGCFDLSVPFSGVRYKLSVRKSSYSDASMSVLAGEGPLDFPTAPAEATSTHKKYFHHKEVPLEASPGDKIDLAVTLEPASVITVAGQVRSHQGAPVPHARIILFAGNANPKTWKDDLHPMRRMLSSMAPSPEEINTPIARTTADETGAWTIEVVNETRENVSQLSSRAKRAIADLRASLGCESPSGTSILVQDVVLAEGQTDKRIDVQLPVPAAAVKAVVVDTQGSLLADIQVRTSHPGQQLTTDDQGRLWLEREQEGRFNLWVTSPGWSILSPSPDERGQTIVLETSREVDHEVRIVLARRGEVTVFVRWSTGKPVIEYELLDHHMWVADPGGVFTLGEFPSGKHTVRVRSAEGVPGSGTVDLEPGGRAAVEMVLPYPGCTLKGQVVDAASSPFHGAKVSVKSEDFETVLLPDERGLFSLKVPPGLYEVSALSLADRFNKVIGEARVAIGPRFGNYTGPDVSGHAPPEAEVLVTVNQVSDPRRTFLQNR